MIRYLVGGGGGFLGRSFSRGQRVLSILSHCSIEIKDKSIVNVLTMDNFATVTDMRNTSMRYLAFP